MRLTDVSIRQLPFVENGQKRIRDELLPGFGVTVGKRSKTFFIMHGPERRLTTLGKYPAVSLQEARSRARQLLSQDTPLQHIKGLRALSDAFLEDCATRLRPNSVRAYQTILQHVPDIPITSANRTTVTVETAHEIKTYKALFNWAVREEITDRNPFLHMTATFNKRERVLNDDEIHAIWHYDHEPYASIVKLLLLTGQRRSQIWKYHPDWCSDNVITFPAELMKSGKSHTVPVTDFTSKYLPKYPFEFNGWSKSQTRLRKHIGVDDFTLHDLRRTYATRMVELDVPVHITEALLAHSSGAISGVAAIYIRADLMKQMRFAVEKYENFIRDLVA